MLNNERYPTYDRGYPESHIMPHLTRRQMRRGRHKRMSRKTHVHVYLAVLTGERKGRKIGLDGEIFRCPICKPSPWREPVTVKAAEGPRDWKPEQG